MYSANVWSDSEKYAGYRIPGLVVTKKGTIIVYCEARSKGCSDWGKIDILLSRSEDGGKTFSEPIIICEGTEDHPTSNNPVCIVGKDGILHFLYCRDYSINDGGIFYIRSYDDGITWSSVKNLMDSSRPEIHNAFALGPGHGICTENGLLLVPVWFVPKSAGRVVDSHHPAYISTFISHDNGDTWEMGEIIDGGEKCPDPNETEAAVCSDGSIYMNVRVSDLGYRARTWSRNGYNGWSALEPDEALPDPTCMGCIASIGYNGRHILLAANCSSKTTRTNLTCFASLDDGKTWTSSLNITPGKAGYSDIAATDEGDVYILYEDDGNGSQEMCQTLVKFHITELVK